MTTLKSTGRRKPLNRMPPKRVVISPATAPTEPSIANQPGAHIVQLQPSLEIKDTETVYQLLSAALAAGGAVTVEVGRLRSVDTAGAQLLLAFQGEAGRRGVTIEFRGESAPLTHTLAVLGLGGKYAFAAAHG